MAFVWIHTIQLSQFLIDKRTAPTVNHNIYACNFLSFIFPFLSETNLPMKFVQSSRSLNIDWWKKKTEEMNITILSLSCQFNNPPLRRWKNATPAEKSTSYIHHHCRRHFCPIECVNFKRRNKKLPSSSSSFFLLLKKTHHHHLLCSTRWSVVRLLTYIDTYIYTYFNYRQERKKGTSVIDDHERFLRTLVISLNEPLIKNFLFTLFDMAKQEQIDTIAYYTNQ